MSNITLYLIGIAVTLFISSTVILILKARLYRLLIDLTLTKERAKFWLLYSNILIILIPFIFSMFYIPSIEEVVFFEIIGQLRLGMLGLVGSLIIIGLVMVSRIPLHDNSIHHSLEDN